MNIVDQNQRLELLKWIAVIAMVIDHSNWIIYGRECEWMTHVGRIAFPLFVFLIIFRLFESPDRAKSYAIKIGAWLIPTEIVYQVILNQLYGGEVFRFSIFTTLFFIPILFWLTWRITIGKMFYFAVLMGVFLIFEPVINYSLFWPGLGLLGLTLVFNRIGFDRTNQKHVLLLMAVAVMAAFLGQSPSSGIFAIGAFLAYLLVALTSYPIYRTPGWLFYAFYPVHLVALFSISVLAGVREFGLVFVI